MATIAYFFNERDEEFPDVLVEIKEIALFDAIHAEILGEKFAEKCRHEKHRAGKEYRHRKPEDRHAHGERYSMSFGKHECGNDHVRNLHREIGLRKDYELEYAELEEIREYNAFVKKCEDEFKKMEEESRKYAELKALEVWLEWA